MTLGEVEEKTGVHQDNGKGRRENRTTSGLLERQKGKQVGRPREKLLDMLASSQQGASVQEMIAVHGSEQGE